MIIQGRLRLAAVGAASLMASMALQGRPASAQLTWDWTDGKREVVSFSPRYTTGQIIVSFGDRRLYLVTQPGQAISYPIAIPKEDAHWQGVTSVTQKRENPSWTPTPSMIAKNPRLPRWVPGGHPFNPLGVRALYLGSSMYRIHGTDAPWTIGTSASSGCIRLYNEDVLDLYPRVKIGAKVTVTYQTFTTTGVSSAPSSSMGGFSLFGSSDDDEGVTKTQAKRPRAKTKAGSDKSAATGAAVPERRPVVETAEASKMAMPAADK